MAIIDSVVGFYLKRRMHQIDLFRKYPTEVQSDWFRKLIAAGVETEFGRANGFEDIRCEEDFKKGVPVTDYEQLEPWIDRIRRGEQNVLWNTEIKWFAKSSGTTAGRSKFIPMSKECLEECHYNGGKDMLALYYDLYPDAEIHKGKSLGMGGSQHESDRTDANYMEGDLSAIIMNNLPIWASYVRTPDINVALMDEWEAKIDQMAKLTIQEDVRSIAGVPSWTLLLLRHILKTTGKKSIREVWPNLEVFFHGGVSFEPYQSQFNEIIDKPDMRYFETYNASEGFFGIQDLRQNEGMMLMLDYGIYYEFLPLKDVGEKFPKTLDLSEVQTAVNYALVITTNGGLWRYLIGDTVMFTSLDPYRIRVTGRVKNFINLAGEEVIIDNAERALASACEASGATISEYTAGPRYGNENAKAAHEWMIEFVVPPHSIKQFSQLFDKALIDCNSDYDSKRYKSMILDEPIITAVPSGTFYQWMKQRGKLGGQNKVPRLYNDRRYLDELLDILK